MSYVDYGFMKLTETTSITTVGKLCQYQVLEKKTKKV